MILVSDGGTEQGHHPIATELVDRPLVPVDLVHQEPKTPVHDLVNCLRVEVLEHGRGVGHVREEDGDELPFSLNGAAGR